MSEIELTEQERKAIASLKRVAKKWPETLWLFVDTSSRGLAVMRCSEKGTRFERSNGRLDPAYMVDRVNIQADGGDW